ncbi:hypothetical protein BH23ACT6_BH23ACT6_23580 [soil metagenome]
MASSSSRVISLKRGVQPVEEAGPACGHTRRFVVGDRELQLSRVVGGDDQDRGELIGGQLQITFTPRVAAATDQSGAYRTAD